MKKFIASLAIASVAAGLSAQETGSSLTDLSITGTFDFETEYVFRGVQLAPQSFQPSVEFGFPVLGGDLYTGIWTNQPIATDGVNTQANIVGNEIDFYGGFAYPVTDMFTADIGFTYYWYPEATTGNIGQTREIYVGVSADVLLSPAIYFYYDFDLQQTVLEFSIGYSFDLGEYVGAEGISIDVGAYYGWLSSEDTNPLGAGDQKNGYGYVGATADLVYAFSENVSASVGVRWAYNNDGDGAVPGFSVNSGKESSVWFGATLGFAY